MNNRVKMKTGKGSYGHGGQVPGEGMIAIKIVQPFEAETEDGRRVMINGGQMMMDGGSVTLKSKDDGTRSYGMGGRVKMDLSSNYEHGGQHPTNEELRQRLAEQNEYTMQEVQGGLEAGAARETQKSKIKRRAELDPEYAINVPRVSGDQVMVNALKGTDPGDAYGKVNVDRGFYMKMEDLFTQAMKNGDQATAKNIYNQMQQQAYRDASKINAQFGYGDTEREYASGMVSEGEMDFNLAFDPQYEDALFNIDNYPGGVPYMHPTMGLQYEQSRSGRGQATDKYIESKKPKGGKTSGVPGENFENGGVTGDPEKKKKENGDGDGDDELATPFAQMLDEVTVTAPATRYREGTRTDQEKREAVFQDIVANNRDVDLIQYGASNQEILDAGAQGYHDLVSGKAQTEGIQQVVDATLAGSPKGLSLKGMQHDFIKMMRQNPDMYTMGPKYKDPDPKSSAHKFTNKHFKYDFDSPEFQQFVEDRVRGYGQTAFDRTKSAIQDPLVSRKDEYTTDAMLQVNPETGKNTGYVDQEMLDYMEKNGLTFIQDPNNPNLMIVGKAQ